MTSDPFRFESSREWLTTAGVVLSLLAIVVAALFSEYSYVFRSAQPFDAVVTKVGMRPAGYEGDAPILTVRLKNGSIRQVMAPWSAVKWCEPGSTVSLIENGRGYRVGLRGCSRHRELIRTS
jgi:hypothetical protein